MRLDKGPVERVQGWWAGEKVAGSGLGREERGNKWIIADRS